MTICYLNGDAVRYALLSVNGSPGTSLSFPSTGSFHTVGSIQTTVTLNTGCNTLEFYNPIVGSWAPDFDRIRFNCPTCAVPTPTPTPHHPPRRLHSTPTSTTDGHHATPTPTRYAHAYRYGYIRYAHLRLRPHLRQRQPRPRRGVIPISPQRKGAMRFSFLTTGAGNTALGWRSLFVNTIGSFNTGVGAGALILNNAGFQYCGRRSSLVAQQQGHTKHRRWN